MHVLIMWSHILDLLYVMYNMYLGFSYASRSTPAHHCSAIISFLSTAVPESDAGSGFLSQHRVSSSKTVRPRAPCGGRCIGHVVSTGIA